MSRRTTQKLRYVVDPVAPAQHGADLFVDTAPRLHAVKRAKQRGVQPPRLMFYAAVAMVIAGLVAVLSVQDATGAAVCFVLGIVWALVWMLWVMVAVCML